MVDIYAGASIDTTAEWSVAGIFTDPDTVTLKFRLKASGPVTTWVFGTDPQITRIGAGVFAATIPTTEPGVAVVQWMGTGAADARLPVTVPVLELPL